MKVANSYIFDIKPYVPGKPIEEVKREFKLKIDPTINTSDIPNKRIRRRVKLFRQGELGRMIRDGLRVAKGTPLSTPEIVASVIASGGHDETAKRAVAPRVRGNLAYLQRQGVVVKIDNGRDAKWRLKSNGG